MRKNKCIKENEANNRLRDRDKKDLLRALSELQIENQLLRCKQDLLDDFFDHVPIGIVIADIEMNIVYCNKSFRRLCRIKKRKFSANSVRDIQKILFPDIVIEDVMPNGKSVSIVFDRHIKSESVAWWLHFVVQRFNLPDTSPAIIVTCQDITSHRDEKSELEHERDRLNAIVRESDVGIIVTDPRGKIVDINEKAMEILECSPDCATGTVLEDAFSIHNMLNGKSYSRLSEQVLASGEALLFPEETVLRTIAGTKKFISGKGFAITDGRSNDKGVAFIIRDITREWETEHMCMAWANLLRRC